MTAHLFVDGDQCSGHARCYLAAAPDLLAGDDEGFVSIRGSSILVPEALRAQARSAVDACPEHAMSFIED